MPPAITDLLDRFGGARRAAIVAVGLLTALAIFGLAQYAARPEWVPAFSGLPLETVGQITEKLDAAGIKYHLEQGGTQVTVASADVARARVLLAKDGLPATGRPGLELFDQPSWGMTDFTQRINYRRALEGELERTIGKMRGVEAAQVHLAIHETSSLRRPTDKPSEASVVLKLRGGQEPERDVVQGIAHLVSSSVDGLEAERVTVLDDAGRLLTESGDGSPSGLSSHQLAVQREVEGYLQDKANEMLAQIVGAGNTRVQVNASINFDKVERTTQQVNPDLQAVSTEQKSEIVPGAEGGAGSTNTAIEYENSRSTETFSGAIGSIRKLSVAVLVNDRLVPDEKAAGGKGAKDAAAAGAAVAAAMKHVPRSATELARIDTLVRNAVGVDTARGDRISVVNASFDGVQPLDEAPAPRSVVETLQTVQRPAISVLGLLLAFGIALMALRALRAAPVPALAAGGAPALAAGASYGALGAGAMPMAQAAPAIPAAPPAPVLPPFVVPDSPSRLRVAGAVEQQPDIAARVVRSWLKEG